jgi:hypothetical protein
MTLAQFLVWLTAHTCAVPVSAHGWIPERPAWQFVGPCRDAFSYGWQMHLPVVVWP